MRDGALLEVRDLHIALDFDGEDIPVVEGISFELEPGKVLALVGESGCGKSVTSQAILRLLPRELRITAGAIEFRPPDGKKPLDLAKVPKDGKAIRTIRGNQISMIFQEPMSSFSILHTMGNQIGEVIRLHLGSSKAEAREMTIELLDKVGISDPARAVDQYPYEFSGGMRQRGMIAKALACNPSLLIADEPTTALDVTIQAQILELMRGLQVEYGMAIVFITHDLGVVAQMADEVAIMYMGPHRRAGPGPRNFSRAETSVHGRSDPRRAATGRFARPAPPGPDPGLCPESLRASSRLCLPSALRVLHDRALRHERAALHGAHPRARGTMLPAWAGPGRSRAMSGIVQVSDLEVHFPVGKSGLFGKPATIVRAVDGVSFEIRRGETFGLVGESGSGKTTLGRAVLRAIEPTAGRIVYRHEGTEVDIAGLDRQGLRTMWRHMQMIFQDPYSSLNPRMTVRDVIGEPLIANELARGAELNERVRDMALRCGLDVEHLGRYPHAFSGGQRQRIAIARALVLHPEFIVCDEPVSALDVSIQAQILSLLKELQTQLGLTYLFIAHDLAAVAHACDRVAVMYLGQLVEVASTEALYYRPRHPYTEALMSAIPEADPDQVMRPVLLRGERPSPACPPAGCRFHTRCRYASEICRSLVPELGEHAPGHMVACHRAGELTLEGALGQSSTQADPAFPLRSPSVG